MGESTRSSSFLAPVGLVWLISLVAGFPVTSPRNATPQKVPAQPVHSTEASAPSKSASSRLWEDPLEATGALTYLPYKGTLNERWTGQFLTESDVRPTITAGDEEYEIEPIFVLTKGMRYADMAEWRRQQRYAVQAALWVKGYAPAQADKLSYRDFSFRTVFGKGDATREVLPGADWYLRVPFEDFQKDKSPKVRIYYINLDLIGKQPLGAIGRIALSLGLVRKTISVSSPPSSDWLNAILDENIPSYNGPIVPSIHFDIYNTLATGDFSKLEDGVEVLTIGPEKEILATVVVHQLIESDSEAIRLIQQEFTERDLDIGGYDWLRGGPCAVAVVSEWETRFGRQFARRMADKFGDAVEHFNYLRGLNGLPPEGRTSGPMPEIQTSGQRAAEARTPGEALSRSFEPTPLPPPFGTSQFDYIARLGESLKSKNRVRVEQGKGEIRAFGLIGTDIDDKIALLKVLRPRFPDALFFTNEMNADFLQPENIAFTRNLIVATHYVIDGMDPKEGDTYFDALPRFRTSAQPAMVHSIWAALGEPQYGKRGVKLYEVGLRHWHPLHTASKPANAPSEEKANQVASLGLRDSFATHFPASVLACVVALVMSLWVTLQKWRISPQVSQPTVFGWALLYLLGERKPQFETKAVQELRKGMRKRLLELEPTRGSKEAHWWWIYAGLVALAGLFWGGSGQQYGSLVMAICGVAGLAWMQLKPRVDHQRAAWVVLVATILVWLAALLGRWTFNRSEWEPLALADGVCLWPSVVLRFLAAGLALHFIRIGWTELCILRDEITRRFFLEREGGVDGGVRYGQEQRSVKQQTERPNGLVPRDFPNHNDLDQGSNPAAGLQPDVPNEAAEWDRYLTDSDPREQESLSRWSRLTGAVLLISAGVMFAVGFPAASSRGPLAKAGDFISLGTALICLSMLCVFVGDQLWQCRKFIRRIWVHGTTGFGFETEETILLVARLTAGVGNLLVYPFAVCFILLCAHSSYFERWLGLIGLYAMLVVALGSLVVFAWKMQRAAHEARYRTVAFLQLNLAEATWIKRLVLQRIDFHGSHENAEKEWWRYTLKRLGRHVTLPEKPRTLEKFEELEDGGAFTAIHELFPQSENGFGKAEMDDVLEKERLADARFHEARIKRIEQLITLVNSIKEGAFGGLHDNPIVRGVLIPSVGLGSLELIQRLLAG